MLCGDILYASSCTPAILICSASPTIASAFVLDTSMASVFTTAVSASSAAVTSNLTCWSRRQTNGVQRPRWIASRPSISMAPALPRLFLEPSKVSVPLVNVPLAKPAPKSSQSDRIALAIDSLNNYELIKPIPVLIESLGDKVFVAESPDLNVSTTGGSVGAAFLLLKEQIITTYEGYRSKKGSDSERARQLAAFEDYIGKPRRHWF